MNNSLEKKQEITVATDNEAVLSKRANDLLVAVNQAEAKDEESAAECVDLLKTVKEHAKHLDKERRLIVDPLNQVVRHVNSRFRDITEPLNKGERILKGKILERQRIIEAEKKAEAERKQREIQEKALEEAAAKEAAGDSISAEVMVDRAARTTVKAHTPAPIQGGGTGAKSSITRKWTYRITDIGALASSQPDMVEAKGSAIMSAFRAGVKNLPGVEFYQEESISVR